MLALICHVGFFGNLPKKLPKGLKMGLKCLDLVLLGLAWPSGDPGSSSSFEFDLPR